MAYKEEFIEFLVQCNALKFGEFTLKSGRTAPYFINTGMFDTGAKIYKLGQFYAHAIKEHFSHGFDGIYGPAYKGIPLCISASIALNEMGIDKGYVFNRKEAKTYGDKSTVVGMELKADSELILIDDVITSGKAIRESLVTLEANNNPKVKGIIISVDRQEKGKTSQNALKEVEEILDIPIHSIVTISQIKEYLYNKKIDGKVYLDNAMLEKIDSYLAEYGAE